MKFFHYYNEKLGAVCHTSKKNITEDDKKYKMYSVLLNVATAQFYWEIGTYYSIQWKIKQKLL